MKIFICDCEGYRNEDIRANEPVVPDLDPDSSDIKVSSVGSSEVSSDPTDFEDEWDDNRPNTVNDAYCHCQCRHSYLDN